GCLLSRETPATAIRFWERNCSAASRRVVICAPFRLALALGFALHARQARVVVGELVEMCERDLRGQDRVFTGHVRGLVVQAMLQLLVLYSAVLLDDYLPRWHV